MCPDTAARDPVRRTAAVAASLVAALLLAGSGDILAQTAAPPPPATARPKPPDPAASWNASTEAREPAAGTSGSTDETLGLTVYRGLVDGVRLPGYGDSTGHRGPVYATDVTAVVTRCADGRQLITALVIGGRLTPLDNHCDEPGAHGAPPRPKCDANAWTCR